jgi:hypothetical protein
MGNAYQKPMSDDIYTSAVFIHVLFCFTNIYHVLSSNTDFNT